MGILVFQVYVVLKILWKVVYRRNYEYRKEKKKEMRKGERIVTRCEIKEEEGRIFLFSKINQQILDKN